MKKSIYLIALLMSLSSLAISSERLTDEQVKKAMIRESIANYSGNCPCPYNLAKNGSSCGQRSAYSRPGGASPICYPNDITQQMLNQYKKRNNL